MPAEIDETGLYSYLVGSSISDIKEVTIAGIDLSVRRSYQNDNESYPLLTYWKESPITSESIVIIGAASAYFFDTFTNDKSLGSIAEWNMRIKTGGFLDNDDEGELENGDLYIRARVVNYI